MPDARQQPIEAGGVGPAWIPPSFSSRVRVSVAARTHPGRVRPSNEDAYLVCRTGRFLERMLSNLPESMLVPRLEEAAYMMLVADGMGGAAGGEVASREALATTIRLMLNAPKWTLHLDDPATRQAEIEEMWGRAEGYLAAIHTAIKQHAAADASLSGMGTTLTGAYSVGADLFVLHVGDSRAYLCRDGKVARITQDHTLAQTFADMGVVPPEEVATHRLRHVLTQAVGASNDQIAADLHQLKLVDRDRLVLCTDGLTNMISEEQIAELLAAHDSDDEACGALVDAALANGGSDNVTVVVASYSIPVVSR